MTTTTTPEVRSGTASIYHVGVDAFLYGCATMLVLLMLAEGLFALLPKSPTGEAPLWGDAVGMLTMVGSFAVGALAALVIHGHSLRTARTWLGMGLGLLVGAAALAMGFFALRRIPSPVAQEGPWGAVIGLVIVVLVFVVPALVAAVRDLIGARRQPVVDWLRLGAAAIALAIVIGSLVIGGETAEAGVFAALFAGGPAAFVALGAAITNRREPA